MSEPVSHTPVLTRVACALLDVHAGETVLDATIGTGGHARCFVELLGPAGTLVGLDVDPANLRLAREALQEARCQVHLLQENFSEFPAALDSLGIGRVHVLFADLGVSSTQLEDAKRGFSFQREGPLDMRMDPRLKVTASDLVNRLKERALADLFYHNAQELAARRIARAICEARRERRISTTTELARIVADAQGVDPASRRAKIHPATRTFLALRIAVNDEITCLKRFLVAAPERLHPEGRVGVITFHSVEDRPVKSDFRQRQKEKTYRLVTKKPVTADATERRANPRSRSAKLRVALRLGDQVLREP